MPNWTDCQRPNSAPCAAYSKPCRPSAVRTLADTPLEEAEITEEESQAVARSREWFKNNLGTSFDDVVAGLSLNLDEIRQQNEPAGSESFPPTTPRPISALFPDTSP